MSTYDVVLLIEQALSKQDAVQVRGLHEAIEEPVRYHVLLPVEDAAMRVESAMGSLGTAEVVTSPSMVLGTSGTEDLQKELLETCRAAVATTVDRLKDAGGDASGQAVSAEPIQALAEKVAEVQAAEAIILTRSHVVAEFFHVDWTHRARRKIGVPVLHLLEHENFDEQAEGYGGEGVTGL